jgi:tripartite-type tricarboxylate transporter receptor subunit TctC
VTVIKRRVADLCAAVVVTTALLSGSPASAQDWPARKLTLVYPFAAGSAGDVVGRTLATRLSELLGQSVVFENVSGAGGMVGISRVAKAAPDGYQLLLSGINLAVNQALHKHPSFDVLADLAPVALLVDQPIVLIARNDLPADNLPAFIAYAKANQAKMQYGSPGVGSAPQLACALLNAAIGINVTHVPYRGGAAVMQDLMAGRIDYQCVITNAAVPHIEGKRVKALALLTQDRSSALPTVATAAEQGLPNVDVNAWAGLWLPRKTPVEIAGRLHDATVAALETPSVQERLHQVGAVVVAPERRSPDYLRKLIESEIRRWEQVVKATGIVAD